MGNKKSTMGNKKSKYKAESSCQYCRDASSSSSYSSDDEIMGADLCSDCRNASPLTSDDDTKCPAGIIIPVCKTDASAREIGYEIVSNLAMRKNNNNKKGIEVHAFGRVNIYVTCIPNTTSKGDIMVDIVNDKRGRTLDIKVRDDGRRIIHRQKKLSHEGQICYAEHRNGFLSVAILVSK